MASLTMVATSTSTSGATAVDPRNGAMGE
jgi:hypothetical protein